MRVYVLGSDPGCADDEVTDGREAMEKFSFPVMSLVEPSVRLRGKEKSEKDSTSDPFAFIFRDTRAKNVHIITPKMGAQRRRRRLKPPFLCRAFTAAVVVLAALVLAVELLKVRF